MEIRKVLVSQPRPTSEKSPYFEMERKYGISFEFKPFIRVETLSTQEFRQQKVYIPDFTAIVFTSRAAVDHFFKLAEACRAQISEELQYFCLSETIGLYLQKYIVYRKRKVHYPKAEHPTLAGLAALMKKYNTEKFLMPVADIHKEDLSVFAKAKVTLTTAVMYRTISTEFTPEEIDQYDMYVFFSPAGIQSLFVNYPNFVQGERKIACFGPSTAAMVKDSGLRLDVSAPSEQFPSMTMAIEAYFKALKAAEEE